MNRIRLLILILFSTYALSVLTSGHSYAYQNSVLATGKWIKIKISERGIYRITRDHLLNNGFSQTDLIPERIKLFGNGGKMLPQKNSDLRPDDLIENAIYLAGMEDGTFDDTDFILFYADGPDSLEFRQDNSIAYLNHPFSDHSYYFLTISDTPGKRIASRTSEGNLFQPIDSYNDLIAYETDQHNILQALITSYGGSGREWYGEEFKDELIQSFQFNIKDLYPSGNFTLITSLMAASRSISSFDRSVNGIPIGEVQFQSIPGSRFGVKGRDRTDTTITSNATLGSVNNIEIELQYIPADPADDEGYLNYFLINAERRLIKENGMLQFQNIAASVPGSYTYSIENLGANDLIWDITNPLEPIIQEFSITGNLGQYGVTASQLRRFVAFNFSEALSPDDLIPVANSNLHALPSPELLIITHEDFLTEAERLASFRQTNDGLNTEVVLANDIYNEFASGSKVPTAIRDFVKHLYDQSSDLKYLLLFGKTSYDPKDRIEGNTNFIPTYVSRNSLDPLRSYTSDDYYGFLEDDEGEWIENSSGDHTLEIGIGRLPVKSLAEAQDVVDKIINYGSNIDVLGKHLNDVYFIGDFGDGNYHIDQSNQLATLVDTTFLNFNSNRFFLDNFELLEQPGRNSFPEATDKLAEVVNKGALIINYTGHGGEEGLSNQFLLRIPDINDWVNFDRLPLMVTATCEFGRHDDPFRISAGELTLLKPDGGCIALVTTARPVFASTNFELNKAFYQRVFQKLNNNYPRLGDIFKETKNNSLNGPNNRNFSLLGDPSMKLAYPRNNIILESINGKPINQSDTLSRLTQLNASGKIVDPLGADLIDYTGTLHITMFDRPSSFATLGQDTQPFQYTARENIIFSGTTSIDQGQFDFSLVLPDGISSEIGSAKILFYASSENTLEDANGASTSVILGGDNANPGTDNTPPDISLYMEDSSFRDGGVVGQNSLLLVRLDDSNGINLLPGSFELRAVLDSDKEFKLANYYESDLDDFTGGWVLFPINGLEKGFHSFTVYASDVYNNQSESTLNFRVENERRVIIENFTNYPNPVIEETTFKFDHNRSGDDLYVQISIISTAGDIVQNLEWRIDNAPTTIDGLKWEEGNFFSKNLTPGVYVGRLLVRSRIDGAKNQAFRRLLIIK